MIPPCSTSRALNLFPTYFWASSYFHHRQCLHSTPLCSIASFTPIPTTHASYLTSLLKTPHFLPHSILHLHIIFSKDFINTCEINGINLRLIKFCGFFCNRNFIKMVKLLFTILKDIIKLCCNGLSKIIKMLLNIVIKKYHCRMP